MGQTAGTKGGFQGAVGVFLRCHEMESLMLHV